jgi:hypothetical protein
MALKWIAPLSLLELLPRHAMWDEPEAPILMPLDVRIEGQMEAVFERIKKDWGPARFPDPLDRVLAQGGSGRARRGCRAGGLSHHHGHVVLDLHPHGALLRSSGRGHSKRRSRPVDRPSSVRTSRSIS